MGIFRRVEYMRCCDGPDCYVSESCDWETRAQATKAAESDGWAKCTRGKWLCPKCKEVAESVARLSRIAGVRVAVFLAGLLVLLCAGSAGASDPLQLFFAGYDHPQPDDSAPFVNPTIAYDESAALPMIPGNWSPDASPGIAAFVAKLTNGVDESLTMSSSEFTTSFMESAKVKQEYFPGANDLRGATISYFRVSRGFDTTLGVRNRRYTVTVYGHLPEPSAGALLLMLCFCLAHVRTGARSRWNSR